MKRPQANSGLIDFPWDFLLLSRDVRGRKVDSAMLIHKLWPFFDQYHFRHYCIVAYYNQFGEKKEGKYWDNLERLKGNSGFNLQDLKAQCIMHGRKFCTVRFSAESRPTRERWNFRSSISLSPYLLHHHNLTCDSILPEFACAFFPVNKLSERAE